MKALQTLSGHLSAASEQYFSIQDWVAKVFKITDADRDSEKAISDQFMSALPHDFIPVTSEPQGIVSADFAGASASPPPQRKQPARFAKSTGIPTPEGFLKHKHVNFSPGLTQEACLDGQIHDDDINEDIGDNDRDVVLSAQKHEAEILAERNNRRRARSEIKRDLN